MSERPRARRRGVAAAAVVAVIAMIVPGGAAALGAKHAPATTTTATATTTAASTTTTASGKPTATAKSAAPAKSGKAATSKSSTAKPKKPVKPAVVVPPLTGWLAASSGFPDETLVLVPPSGKTVTGGDVHVSENGTAVPSLTATPASASAPGDFGIMLALDQNSTMSGAGMAAEMSAAKALAAGRSAHQEIGIVGSDSTSTLLLPLTSDTSLIDTTLKAVPWTADGSAPGLGVIQAISQLTTAKTALGAVIVVSDGAGLSTTGGATSDEPTASAIAAAAAEMHTQIVVVGLQDGSSTPASLHALAQAIPGLDVSATPSRLPSVVQAIAEVLGRDEIVHYRSDAGFAKLVNVTASATGLPGTVAASYQAPKAPVVAAAPVHRPAPTAAHHHAAATATGANAAGSARPTSVLTPTPAFATGSPATAPQSNSGFWASSAAVFVIAGICALLMALALALALYRPSVRAARTRVGSFIPTPGDEEAISRAQRKGGRLGGLRAGGIWTDFVATVAVSRSRHSPAALVRRAALMAVVLAALMIAMAGSVLFALLPLIAWPFVLRWFVKRAAEKQRAKFRDTLPSYLQDLASSIRVGRSLVGAFAVIAASADEPTRSELERAVTDESLGRPLEECLEAVALRMESRDMDQVALIAGLNRLSGSNVAESLDRVAEGARERADVRREMRALTAQAKMSSSVLTGLPGVLLLGLSILSPLYAHPLLHTTMGLVALGVGATMVLAGWRVMKKITDVGDF